MPARLNKSKLADIYSRLASACKKRGVSAVAKSTGVTPKAIYNALKRGALSDSNRSLKMIAKLDAKLPKSKPAPGKAAKAKKTTGLENLILGEQLDLLLKLDIPEELIENAESIATVQKALNDMASANEKLVRTMLETGRLVDVLEVDALVKQCIGDWIEEVKGLPATFDAQIALDHKIKVSKARAVLTTITDHLLGFATKILDDVDNQTANFMQSKQPRKRKLRM